METYELYFDRADGSVPHFLVIVAHNHPEARVQALEMMMQNTHYASVEVRWGDDLVVRLSRQHTTLTPAIASEPAQV